MQVTPPQIITMLVRRYRGTCNSRVSQEIYWSSVLVRRHGFALQASEPTVRARCKTKSLRSRLDPRPSTVYHRQADSAAEIPRKMDVIWFLHQCDYANAVQRFCMCRLLSVYSISLITWSDILCKWFESPTVGKCHIRNWVYSATINASISRRHVHSNVQSRKSS